jgi:hypothetical protein
MQALWNDSFQPSIRIPLTTRFGRVAADAPSIAPH